MIPYYPLGVYKESAKEEQMTDLQIAHLPASADRACCSRARSSPTRACWMGKRGLLAALLRPGDARRHGQLQRSSCPTTPVGSPIVQHPNVLDGHEQPLAR